MVSANVSQLRYTEVFTEKQGLAPPVLAVEVQGLAKVELRIEVVQWNCESQTDPVALRRHNGDSSQFTSKKRDLTSLNWIPRNRDLANSNLEFADQHK